MPSVEPDYGFSFVGKSIFSHKNSRAKLNKSLKWRYIKTPLTSPEVDAHEFPERETAVVVFGTFP